mmetsp:Transcript_1420/g.3826  ORF Transcript_1420/g.3826 Transcript_1420/m.3826 type:complete len:204 (+) Transcript_1420:1891-2502(+)
MLQHNFNCVLVHKRQQFVFTCPSLVPIRGSLQWHFHDAAPWSVKICFDEKILIIVVDDTKLRDECIHKARGVLAFAPERAPQVDEPQQVLWRATLRHRHVQKPPIARGAAAIEQRWRRFVKKYQPITFLRRSQFVKVHRMQLQSGCFRAAPGVNIAVGVGVGVGIGVILALQQGRKARVVEAERRLFRLRIVRARRGTLRPSD